MENAKKKKGYTFRKFINDVHLWIGVGSSLVLFLVCLSGTIYTFRHEIEELVEPEKFHVEASGSKAPVADLIAATQQTSQGKVTRVSWYDDASKPFELQVSKSKEDKRGETFYVNPYSNEVIGTGKGPTSKFFMFWFKMHRWLLMDESIGRPIVGIATLLFVILTLTGLFLWFPKKYKNWKSLEPGFKIKFSAKWKRINHDLHNALGFYSFLIVLIMALTGLNWSFEWYKDGMSDVLGAKVFGQRGEKPMPSTPVASAEKLSVEKIIEIGNKEFQYSGKSVLGMPKGPDGSYEFKKLNADNLNKESSDKIVIDQYSGAILKRELYADKSIGQKIASQIRSIHTGEIYGLFSKIIYFIACLIATSLPVTGIFIWLNKMKKSNQQSKKAVVS